MGMTFKKRNALFGRYPSCDLLNNALRLIFKDEELSKNELDATSEIIFAIQKAGGYFHKDLEEQIAFVMEYRKRRWLDA
jgi:hypothetical protein